MRKSRRNIRNSKRVLNTVNTGLKNVTNTAKIIGQKSKPIIETGLSGIYGTLAKGFNLGITGVSKGVNAVKKITAKQRYNKSHKKHNYHKKTRRH
jgi:6-phosphogluconate dehydrogenase (decarboxylating)